MQLQSKALIGHIFNSSDWSDVGQCECHTTLPFQSCPYGQQNVKLKEANFTCFC